MAKTDRWRCLQVGCNPKLNESTANQHKGATGHRVAKWPVRSEAGKRKQRERDRTSGRAEIYGPNRGDWYNNSIHPFSEEAFD